MTKEEMDLIIVEQNKSTEEILKAIEQEKCELLGIIQGKDKTIKELEKENAELRNNGFSVSAMTEQQLKVALEKGEQLEKENEQLKSIAEFQQSSNMKRHFEIQELEKKNAELKKELKDSNEKVVHLACNQNKDLKYKLTKAKEIIKELMSFSVQLCDCRHTVDFKKTREQAVQFLKEIEK